MSQHSGSEEMGTISCRHKAASVDQWEIALRRRLCGEMKHDISVKCLNSVVNFEVATWCCKRTLLPFFFGKLENVFWIGNVKRGIDSPVFHAISGETSSGKSSRIVGRLMTSTRSRPIKHQSQFLVSKPPASCSLCVPASSSVATIAAPNFVKPCVSAHFFCFHVCAAADDPAVSHSNHPLPQCFWQLFTPGRHSFRMP